MAVIGNAAARAEQAADDAVRGAGVAVDAAAQAKQHAQALEQLVPDPHAAIVAELATHEQSGLLNIGPKRNRWSELQAFDEQLIEIERRREELGREIAELTALKNNEPARIAAELDAWLMGGQQGERPSSRAAALEQQVADLQAELGASAIGHDRLLRERADHVERNRTRMLRDMKEEIEATASEYRALVETLEQTRRELLELRQTEVWTAIYPSHTLANEPNTAALVGAKKALQGPLLPGRASNSGLVATQPLRAAEGRRPLLRKRRDRRAGSARTGRLGRPAAQERRALDGQHEAGSVGPAFASTWGGSDEEKAEAEGSATTRSRPSEGCGESERDHHQVGGLRSGATTPCRPGATADVGGRP